LPVTWYRSVYQLPIDAGNANYDPLFPVGYGLNFFQSGDNSK
jgi:beta-glucosidase